MSVFIETITVGEVRPISNESCPNRADNTCQDVPGCTEGALCLQPDPTTNRQEVTNANDDIQAFDPDKDCEQKQVEGECRMTAYCKALGECAVK